MGNSSSNRAVYCWFGYAFFSKLHSSVEFVILTDLVFIYFASYTYFTSTYFPWLPNCGSCAGEEFAAFAGIASISSYLIMFISFYIATYRKDGRAPSARKAVRRMSQAPIPDSRMSEGHGKTTGVAKIDAKYRARVGLDGRI